jgi:hypothetical protein
MVGNRFVAAEVAALSALLFWSGSSLEAAGVRRITVFAEGTAVNATGPDSLAVTDDAIWVSYTNNADSTGLGGSSTVVEYSFGGHVRRTFQINGSVDGLKQDPRTGLIWAMQNQDGNSTLTLIDPDDGIVPGSPFQYAVTSSTHGYDDVVFRGSRTFLSYTNPTGPSDPTIQMLIKGTNPLAVTPILLEGATGTNLATRQRDQPTTQNDPDSLKLTPSGDLMLTSGDDGQLVFVAHPGTDDQAVSFLTLLDPVSHQHVSGLDDALFPTASRGVFYLSDTGNNRVLAIEADDLEPGDLFASVGSVNELALVDLSSGNLTSFVGNLNGPHGLVFVPSGHGDQNDQH